jgi:iron complex transport system ATP-binding protein
LHCLAGSLPGTGRVTIDGVDLSGAPNVTKAQRIAVLPQAHSLQFPLRVSEVVELGCAQIPVSVSSARQTIEQATKLTDIAHLLGHSYQALSGGEQARVQLARVLVQALAARTLLGPAPTITLLLDEPVAALDIKHQLHVLGGLAGLAGAHNLAVVVVLHDLNLALRYCRAGVLMANGCVLAQGAMATVATKSHLKAAFELSVELTTTPSGHPLILFEVDCE